MASGNKFVLCVAALFAFLCINVESVTPKADKLNFGIYITSMCPDTNKFIRTQLTPVFKEFEEHMRVEFFPWGKSKRNDDNSITCQFGPNDCQANRLQSCALYILGNNQGRQVDYINCEMVTLAATNMNYTCVRDAGVSEATAKQCYESSLGTELQSIAEEKTKDINLAFVPTIVLDNKYDADVQEAAFTDFRGFVCSLLEKDNSNICK